MTRRAPRLPEQLSLSAVPDNDVAMDNFMRGARVVSPGDAALATQAGDDGPQVATALAKKRSNQARGRLAQRHGKEFEAWLTSQHNLALRPGPDRLLSWAIHIEAEAKYLRDRATGEKRLTHTADAYADFVLMSTRAWGSRVLVVEAKSVWGVGARLSLNDIQPQQREHLVATWKEGGVAALAVEFREPGPKGFVDTFRRFAIRWAEIRWVVGGRGGWSIGAEDCAGFEVPPETGPRRQIYVQKLLEAA